MPLIVPLISCFYANQTFLGLDGFVNNPPAGLSATDRPPGGSGGPADGIARPETQAWARVGPQRPCLLVFLEAPNGSCPHFTEGEAEATVR